MSRTPAVEQRPQEAAALPGGRARILDVARAAFIARGYADVSMQEIAAAAGLSKAAIYHHFTDKDALFEQVLFAEVAYHHDELVGQIALGGSLRTQVERIARYAFAFRLGNWNRLIADANRFGAAERIPGLQDRVNSTHTLVRGVFERARDDGEIRAGVDLDIATTLFLSMIGSQVRSTLVGSAPDASPEARAAMAADMVMGGIGG